MIRIIRDASSGLIFIDGREDPIAGGLQATLSGDQIAIANIYGGKPIVCADFGQIADAGGNGFASAAAAIAYLDAQFTMQPQGCASYTAAGTIFGAYAVMYVGAISVEHADPTAGGYVFAGIATQGAASGAPVLVQKRDAFAFSGWSWTTGEPVFALPGGSLTQAPPDAGVCHEIGAALDATTLLIAPRDPVFL